MILAPLPDALEAYAPDLAWLDCLVEREMLRLRARYELSLDELRGLYISDRQVDELLRERASARDGLDPAEHLSLQALELRRERRDDTPLQRLAGRLDLSAFETDLLLLALAPELALRYETLYAYLNNDITRKHPTVDLALRLLDDGAVPVERRALRPGAPLFARGLLEIVEAPGEGRSTLAQGFVLSPPTLRWLQGLPADDPRLPRGVCLEGDEGIDVERERLAPAAQAAVTAFAAAHRVEGCLAVCRADAAAEGVSAARLFATARGRPLLKVPLSILADATAWEAARGRLPLQVRLTDAVVAVFDERHHFPTEPAALLRLGRGLEELAAQGAPLVWVVPREASWGPAVADLPFVELVLPVATSDERADTWRDALARAGLPAERVSSALAERFALPCSRIRVAAETAARRSAGAADEATVDAALWQAARQHSNQSLGQLASHVVRPHRWEHLVLPAATLDQVREVASAIDHRERVFRRWRMAERVGRGQGLMVLFAGASGTGKTMTASVIANSLELDLYRIDLAAVVSKYIGETEKNLDRIFQAARHSNAILFFDEADALLGKRSEVKDAHDRYGNIEVAYLLQKMEEHEGVMVLASNMPKNLDQAFSRRMHYVVEFPRPDAPLRERLWRGMFPEAAPLDDDVDFAFLAEQFDTSGGDIQAIALDAAFLASADGGTIGMSVLVKAMARHQLKQGNPAGVSGFRQYHGMARRG